MMVKETRVPDKCLICEERMQIRLENVLDPISEERFSVWSCQSCKVSKTDPIPDQLDRYYGSKYYGGRHGFTEAMCMRRRLGFLSSVQAHGSLLDYGCGDGGFLAYARERGQSGIGVDMAPDDARKKGLVVFSALDDVKGRFDVVTLWHVLEHMRDPKQTLRDLSKHLEPNAKIFIAVPNISSWQSRLFGKYWFHLDVPRHTFHFDPKSLKNLLNGEGYSIVKYWNLESELEVFGWIQSALNLMLKTPNILFNSITGRPTKHQRRDIAISYFLGCIIGLIAVPAAIMSSLFRGGGILIIAARYDGDQARKPSI